MKNKKIKYSLFSLGATLPIFALASCGISSYNPMGETLRKKDDEKKPKITSSKNNSGSTKEKEDYKDFPMPDVKYKQEGLKKVWNYVKQIPDLVKRENQNLIFDNERINNLIIEKYNKTLEILGEVKDTKFDIYDTGLIKEYEDLFNLYPDNQWKRFVQYVNDPERLFIFEKNLEEAKKEIMGIEFELAGMMGLLVLTSQKEIRYIRAYIEYQKALYSTIKDSSKTLEEQLKNNLVLKKSINYLISGADEFLNPISHLARNKDVIWNEHPLANYKEMYDDIIQFFNEEIAPLTIKLGYKSNNPISQWSLNEYVLKYFYPKINNRIKVNYSDLEINQFWVNFKTKKPIYKWKTLDI